MIEFEKKIWTKNSSIDKNFWEKSIGREIKNCSIKNIYIKEITRLDHYYELSMVNKMHTEKSFFW